tara:strand:- start:107 stop:328 length:222 start_codon:yes stop_codon:yes gene_type:complete
MGKGSGRRPTDQVKFDANYDKIFNNKKKAEWEDEDVKERHLNSLKDKDGKNKSDSKNTKKATRKRRVSARSDC